MALASKSDLFLLGYSFQGEVFCDIRTKATIDCDKLEKNFGGQIFWAGSYGEDTATPKIFHGAIAVTKMYVGSTAVTKVYIGETFIQ